MEVEVGVELGNITFREGVRREGGRGLQSLQKVLVVLLTIRTFLAFLPR